MQTTNRQHDVHQNSQLALTVSEANQSLVVNKLASSTSKNDGIFENVSIHSSMKNLKIILYKILDNC